MLTTQQAADELGVTRLRVRQLIKAGRLRAVMFGRDWHIEEADLEAVRERRTGRPKKDGADGKKTTSNA